MRRFCRLLGRERGVVDVALVVEHDRSPELQRDSLVRVRFGGARVVERQRVVVAPLTLRDPAALAEQACGRAAVLGRLHVCAVRLVVAREQLTDVSERLLHARDLLLRRFEGDGRRQRALVERRGVDVRVLRARVVAAAHRIPPRLLPLGGLGEVEREHACLRSRVGRAALERLAHACVDLAASREREALVRGRAHEVVPEAQPQRPLPVDEVREPLPLLGIGRLLGEGLGQEIEVERRLR